MLCPGFRLADAEYRLSIVGALQCRVAALQHGCGIERGQHLAGNRDALLAA